MKKCDEEQEFAENRSGGRQKFVENRNGRQQKFVENRSSRQQKFVENRNDGEQKLAENERGGMTDNFGRKIDYMRISVTEQCNLRCRYCAPSKEDLARRDAFLGQEALVRQDVFPEQEVLTWRDASLGQEDLARRDASPKQEALAQWDTFPVRNAGASSARGLCRGKWENEMTREEILLAAEAAASLGIRKIRITGGEPLVRRDIVSICESCAAVKEIEEVCLTTNGLLLPELAAPLREAGVKRLNISLDTLDESKYRDITGSGRLGDALAGLEAALGAGFERIKINTVLIGGFNDDEIASLADLTRKYPVDVRFIELMPMEGGGGFDGDAFISNEAVTETLEDLEELDSDGGVARLYRLPEGKGNVGLISPVSAPFCGRCSRIRLTADGRLKPCLHSALEYSIRGMDFDGIRRQMEAAIKEKPRWHGGLEAGRSSRAGRSMKRIGG